jgi:hypothetical protein
MIEWLIFIPSLIAYLAVSRPVARHIAKNYAAYSEKHWIVGRDEEAYEKYRRESARWGTTLGLFWPVVLAWWGTGYLIDFISPGDVKFPSELKRERQKAEEAERQRVRELEHERKQMTHRIAQLESELHIGPGNEPPENVVPSR